MPLTRNEQQQKRRYETKRQFLINSYEVLNIDCIDFNQSISLTVDKIEDLQDFLKRLKKHRLTTDKLVASGLLQEPTYTPPVVEPEPQPASTATVETNQALLGLVAFMSRHMISNGDEGTENEE